MTKHFKFSLLCAAFLTCLIITGQPVRAQQAAITGQITDQAGAVVPGAEVTLTNVETLSKASAATNEDGVYTIPLLPPGNYNITVAVANFKTFVQQNVKLDVAQRAKFDFQLEAGQVSETVTVSAETAQLTSSETSSLSQVIDEKRINDLPLNGRNPLELSRLTPGVNLQATAFNDARNFNLTSASINGGPSGTNAILLDGGSATLPERNEYSVSPNVDAVKEFRVQTNSFSSEYGLTGGGVINIVTKSGTNGFHGSLFEFVRNDRFDANTFARNRVGTKKPPLRYNQFGGTVGGPIFFPGFGEGGPVFFNGRDKAFFLFNYEGFRFKTQDTQLLRLPTLLERRGDFSQTFVFDSTTRTYLPVVLYDPTTTNAAGNVRNLLLDANGNPTVIIPINRLDPVALRTLQFFPLPNRVADNPSGSNNYVATPPNSTNNNQYSVRFDFNLTANSKINARFTQNHANSLLSPLFSADNPAEPGGATQDRNNKNFVFGYTQVIRPTVFNDFRFTLNRQALLSAPPGFNLNAPSLIGLPSSVPNFLFPRFNIGDVQAIGNNAGFLALRGQTTGQIFDAVTVIAGKHSLKFGVDLRNNLRNDFSPGNASGAFDFSRGQSGSIVNVSGRLASTTGFGFATFLLGAVSGGNLNVGIAKAEGYRSYSGFVQDDYKFSQRLTLNLGLRYDLIKPSTERFDRYSNFNPTRINPIVNAPGVVEYASDFGRSIQKLDKNNFGPRVGFAYDVFGDTKTIVRGGFGIFYYHNAIREFPDTQGFSQSTNFTSVAQSPVFNLQQGPASILQPFGNTRGAASFLGDNVTYYQPDDVNSSAQQWNLGIQRELPYNILLDVAYAGNHGVHQFTQSYDANALNPQFYSLGTALSQQVANPYFNVLPVGSPLRTATITRLQSLRPYPYFGNITVLNPKLGNSVYNSLQLKAEKRFSQGLSFLVAYTGSKKIGDVGRGVIDFATTGGAEQVLVSNTQSSTYNRQLNRSIEPEDVSRNLVTSFVYELPVGRGKSRLSNGFLSYVFGNFTTQGIFTYRTGVPLAIRGAANNSGNIAVADRPNQLRSAVLPNGERSADRWFDTTAFVAAAPFTFGDAPRTQPDLRGPSFYSFDFSVFKNIPFSERYSVQLRAEVFNVFNHTNLGLPNTNFLSPDFGKIFTALDPRRIQFGAKFYF